MLRHRRQQAASIAAADPAPDPLSPIDAPRGTTHKTEMDPADPERRPLLAGNDGHRRDGTTADDMTKMAWTRRNQWILFAIASGACAAFNGVMAKLTTTELTTSLSQGIARLLGISAVEGAVEAVVRASFFALNLIFNGVMWTLFTQALARGNSTTQVSIMNTSSNFVLTALLGFVIFSESLPPMWWLGASMLVAGNVIIGSKTESTGDKDGDVAAENGESDYEPISQTDGAMSEEDKVDEDDDDVPQLGVLDEDEDTRR